LWYASLNIIIILGLLGSLYWSQRVLEKEDLLCHSLLNIFYFSTIRTIPETARKTLEEFAGEDQHARKEGDSAGVKKIAKDLGIEEKLG
jgi:hypothetical protein